MAIEVGRAVEDTNAVEGGVVECVEVGEGRALGDADHS